MLHLSIRGQRKMCIRTRNLPLPEVAGAMGTIDYEILTRLGARLDRRYSGAE